MTTDAHGPFAICFVIANSSQGGVPVAILQDRHSAPTLLPILRDSAPALPQDEAVYSEPVGFRRSMGGALSGVRRLSVFIPDAAQRRSGIGEPGTADGATAKENPHVPPRSRLALRLAMMTNERWTQGPDVGDCQQPSCRMGNGHGTVCVGRTAPGLPTQKQRAALGPLLSFLSKLN